MSPEKGGVEYMAFGAFALILGVAIQLTSPDAPAKNFDEQCPSN